MPPAAAIARTCPPAARAWGMMERTRAATPMRRPGAPPTRRQPAAQGSSSTRRSRWPRRNRGSDFAAHGGGVRRGADAPCRRHSAAPHPFAPRNSAGTQHPPCTILPRPQLLPALLLPCIFRPRACAPPCTLPRQAPPQLGGLAPANLGRLFLPWHCQYTLRQRASCKPRPGCAVREG